MSVSGDEPATIDPGVVRSPMVGRVAGSRPLLLAVVLVGLMLVLVSALRFQAPAMLGQPKVLTDFDAFHIAGRMAIEGKVADAYHMRSLLAAQLAKSGAQGFMPWTYPPPFTLMMQGLAHLPIGWAFALFALSTFAFYLWVLRRIAGPWFPGAVIAVMPAVLLNLRTGQNGFLIAGLIGCFLLALRDRRSGAGLPLGLMIIKPHLAAGVGLAALLQRRWSVVVVAGFVALGLLAVSTLAYGLGIWLDFRNAVQEAGEFLASGDYYLFRMSSLYASAYTLGLGAKVAMAVQVLGAVAALGVLGRACLRGGEARDLAALTCLASLFVSPYGYDYDLTILGVALAFLMPDLLARGSGRQILLLLALTWFVCGFGLGWAAITPVLSRWWSIAPGDGPALIGPALLLLCWRLYALLQPSSSSARKALTSAKLTSLVRKA